METYSDVKFGKLTVQRLGKISLHVSKNGRKRIIKYYVCKCECGNIVNRINICNLKSGNTTSCGCERSKNAKIRSYELIEKNKHYIEYNGERKCLKEWAVVFGISQSTISKRIKNGMPEIEAITKPVNKNYNNRIKNPYKY